MIQCGRCIVKKTIPGYSLHKGSGDRKFIHSASFPNHFSSAPNLFVGICQLDSLKDADHRIIINPTNVKNTGFSLEVGTWSNSKIWSCSVSWLAFDKSFSSPSKNLS